MVETVLEFFEEYNGMSTHKLRSVDQCKAFFWTEKYWFHFEFFQYFGHFPDLSVVYHFSHAYKRKKQV